MQIDINQSKISIGDKYAIYIDGEQRHNAASKLFRFFSEIELFEWNSDLPNLTIKKRFEFFSAKYDIIRSDGRVYQFRTKSFWRDHYQCRVDSDIYDIYGHRGRRYSIYKNGRQIAWWTKQAVTWFHGDNYQIIAYKDSDYNLVIAFCLIMDNYKSEGKKAAINFNIGKVGPEERKFDPHWQPKL